MKNEFSIIVNDKYYFYDDLMEETKREIWNLGLTFNVVYEYFDKKIDDKDLIKWFCLLNYSGTPADKKHLEYLSQV